MPDGLFFNLNNDNNLINNKIIKDKLKSRNININDNNSKRLLMSLIISYVLHIYYS